MGICLQHLLLSEWKNRSLVFKNMDGLFSIRCYREKSFSWIFMILFDIEFIPYLSCLDQSFINNVMYIREEIKYKS